MSVMYVRPKLTVPAFTCPHCGVLAQQHASGASEEGRGFYRNHGDQPIGWTNCEYCGRLCLWHFDNLVFPSGGVAPPANADMPPEVKSEYEEAASISHLSPRAAAALLRLAIQKLSVELGCSGDNLNEDIGELVRQGLPERVQKALDIVRVIGNNAVHPGEIDADDPDIAKELFTLCNVIVEYMITLPGKLDGFYEQSYPMARRSRLRGATARSRGRASPPTTRPTIRVTTA